MKKKSSEQTVSEVGRTFVHRFDGLDVEVEIKSARVVFGRREWEVSVAGQPNSNKVWIYALSNPQFTR